ncbi:MAG: adenosylmethionine--8-amino-7-oxononanoate transaminase, partial [Candidatus Omnitrophica bacterium]|nr:adenosylmethionine--8-amino-7-oxononanoate transaminase [Candidatus Omnitrophota bacterium]
LQKAFFSDNGSTAVEVALKMSFQYWKNIGIKTKTKFVSLDYAYHGDTIGAMSVSGVSLFNEVFKPLFFKSYKVPSPYCYRCPIKKLPNSCKLDCIKPLEKLLENKNSEIAAIILEPLVLAAGGMIIYPREYLEKVAKLAKKYNVHLILDEVATGFGRTGKMFACQHARVEPDFMCLAKGITSGTLPLAVTLTTDKIYKAFYDDYYKKKTFYHGHTYTANPIACTAALATLKIFEEEKILENLKQKIDLFATRLKEFNDLDFVGDVRTIGLIGAIELVKDKDKKIPFSFEERIGFRIYKEAFKKGLILRPLGNVIYFFFPLCISKNQLEYILSITYQLIKRFNF